MAVSDNDKYTDPGCAYCPPKVRACRVGESEQRGPGYCPSKMAADDVARARALYDDPVIVVLDEPNSNLDNVGSQALNHAIRQMKADQRSVLIMAHRPAAIQECDTLLVLDGGMRMAFGPKDEILRKMVTNHRDIQQGGTARPPQGAAGGGGATR